MVFPRQKIYCKNIFKIFFKCFSLKNLKKKEIKSYKNNFKKFLDIKMKYVHFLSRGRMGLFHVINFLVSNHREKKEIILSPYTIFDLVNMILLAGGKPVFIDNQPKSFEFDTDSLIKYLDKYHYKVSAILVCQYSVNTDINKIKKICKKYSIKLILDLAISPFANLNQKSFSNFSDYTFFSFNIFKFISSIQGGALVFNDKKFNEFLNTNEKNWPIEKNFDQYLNFFKGLYFKFFTNNFIFNLVTFRVFKFAYMKDINFIKKFSKNDPKPIYRNIIPKNYAIRFNNQKLPFVLSALKDSFNFRSQREKNFIYFLKFIKNNKILMPNYEKLIGRSSFINFPLIVKDREKFSKFLYKMNIDHSIYFYRDCSSLKIYKNFKFYCKNVNYLSKHLVFLPTHHELSDQDLKRIVAAINLF